MLHLLDPRPEPLWPLSFIAGLEAGQAGFPVLTLYFEQGAYHGGTEDHSDDDLEDVGTVLGRIRSFPAFVLGFDPTAARLGLPRYVVEWDDPDGELADILTGEQAITGVLRVQAVARLGAEDQSANDWPIIWTGVLVESLSLDGNSVRLVLTQDDAELTKPVLADSVDGRFPYAREDAREQPVPRAVGTFDSRASATSGAVPCLYVDTRASEWRFLVVAGWAAEVPRVWADGVLQTEGADYNVLHDSVRGLSGTWVQFLADPGADVDVRCDLTGLESVGDGTGTQWHTPALQLRALIGDDRTLLDAKSLAEVDDFLTANRRRPRLSGSTNAWTQGRRPARIVTSGDMRKLDLLNEWCQRWQVFPYWNEAGLVAFAVVDHRDKVTYHDAPHWVRAEDLFDPPKQYALRPGARNRFVCGNLFAEDRHAALVGEEKLPERWSEERLSEADLVPYTTPADDGWALTGGYDVATSVDNPPWTPDSEYASWTVGTGTFRLNVRMSDGPQVPRGAPQIVEVRWRAKGSGTAQAGVYIGGTPYYGSTETLTGSWTNYTATFETNPDTSAAWVEADINPDLLQVIVSATGGADVRAVRLRVYTLDGGPAVELAREALSRRLMLSAQAVPMTELRAVLSRGAIRPGDAFSVSTPDAVAPGAAGWGTETWERRRHVLCSRTLQASRKAWTLCALDARDIQLPLWETGDASGFAPLAPGILRVGAYQAGLARSVDGRRFSRSTDAAGDPTGVATISSSPYGTSETIPADHERYSSAGLPILPSSGSGPAVASDRLRYLWLHDGQPWPVRGGTALIRFVYQVGGNTVFRCGSDVLTVSGGTLTWRRSVNGTDYDATIDLTGAGIITGILAVGLRWTPGEGGLTRDDEDENLEDVPPYTLDAWVNQGGTTARATPVVAVEGFPGDYFDLGTDEGSGAGHVYVSWRATPQLLTDDEIAARLEQLAA